MMVLKRELASIQTLERSRTSCTSVPWHATQARQGSVGVGRGGCQEQDSPHRRTGACVGPSCSPMVEKEGHWD